MKSVGAPVRDFACTSPKALVMSGTQGPMSRHQRVWAVTPGRRHTTEGPPLREPIRFVLCGASSVYLVIVAASMSTRAHFVPVLQAPGFSVPFLPRDVTVTVWVPAARASRAQTTRAGCTVGE